jgi:hypothetical protein
MRSVDPHLAPLLVGCDHIGRPQRLHHFRVRHPQADLALHLAGAQPAAVIGLDCPPMLGRRGTPQQHAREILADWE